MNIISYVWFGEHYRYWGNLPFILVCNNLFFPDFVSKFYVHRKTTGLDAFKLLQAMEGNGVEIEIVDGDYQNTELTIQRMKPLWDKNCKYLFCRDLDAVTTSLEIKAIRKFLENDKLLVQGIRSYALHTIPLMAGLCGFNCEKIREENFMSQFLDFDSYRNLALSKNPEWHWGCDQEILGRFFYQQNNIHMMNQTLDVPLRTAPVHLHGYTPIRFSGEEYDAIDLSGLNQSILLECDKLAGFEGRPMNVKPEQTKMILSLENEVVNTLKKVFSENEKLEALYGIQK